jgi:putative integral membrane protein (TIGR02587 family)
VLIALTMTPWHTIALLAASLLAMHAFVYTLEFRWQHRPTADVAHWRELIRFTVPGYLIALAISSAICWCFGRFDGLPVRAILQITLVLGFPAAVGAAAARLVLTGARQ